MKALVVEDDFTSRLLLQSLLKQYGSVETAVTGVEAVQAVYGALEAGEPYQLICLDIMMPEMDGLAALKKIRAAEEEWGLTSTRGAKILMTTALDDVKHVCDAYYELCDGYLVKPIERAALIEALHELKLA